ncbi:MAG: 5-formyltetrahydrofolate cyclo-ligase [Tissierellia bacterium]|nr:5-formyltetrahydrofolate cyclo-ligase [Tissierellia bacterium]MDD4780371.1 5-formyltetrahydrofolate cyclo-ligase [Tissierellia bacterium]
MGKSEIRKYILNIRNNLNNTVVNEKSKIIINKLISLEEFKNSKTVFIYMDFRNEVRTGEIINFLLEQNKRVVLPWTDTANTEIVPVEIKDMENDLITSSFGYLEPKKENVIEVKVEEIDLIIVPGVAFDKRFNRIGFGKGYYDRILNRKRKNTLAIAIAYEFQVLEEIPYEEHDIKMDAIITEENMYRKED